MEPRLIRHQTGRGHHNLQTPAEPLDAQCHGLTLRLTPPHSRLPWTYPTSEWVSMPSKSSPSVPMSIRHSKPTQKPRNYLGKTRTSGWECEWSLRCSTSAMTNSVGVSSGHFQSPYSATYRRESPPPSTGMVVRWGNPDLRQRGRRAIPLPNPLDIRTDSRRMEKPRPSGFSVSLVCPDRAEHQRTRRIREAVSEDKESAEVMIHE